MNYAAWLALFVKDSTDERALRELAAEMGTRSALPWRLASGLLKEKCLTEPLCKRHLSAVVAACKDQSRIDRLAQALGVSATRAAIARNLRGRRAWNVGGKWSEARDEVLYDDWSAGVSVTEILAKVVALPGPKNLTISDVGFRASGLRLRRPPGFKPPELFNAKTPDTPRRIARVAALWDAGMSRPQIEKEMRLSPGKIAYYANTAKAKGLLRREGDHGRKVTDEQIAAAIPGRYQKDVAAMFGVSRAIISRRLKEVRRVPGL